MADTAMVDVLIDTGTRPSDAEIRERLNGRLVLLSNIPAMQAKGYEPDRKEIDALRREAGVLAWVLGLADPETTPH